MWKEIKKAKTVNNLFLINKNNFIFWSISNKAHFKNLIIYIILVFLLLAIIKNIFIVIN